MATNNSVNKAMPSGTVVGTSDTQTLTNKNFSSSTNTFPDFYPVGTVYYNKTNSANPSTYLPGQSGSTWVQLTDVFIVAHGSTYTGTGGSASHTHTLNGGTAWAEIMISTSDIQSSYSAHSFSINRHGTGITGTGTSGTQTNATDLAGTTDSTTNVPPYQAVYAWERTA